MNNASCLTCKQNMLMAVLQCLLPIITQVKKENKQYHLELFKYFKRNLKVGSSLLFLLYVKFLEKSRAKETTC